MNPAHIHLMINHIPVLGAVAVVALFAYSLLRASKEVDQLTLGAAVLIGLLTVPAFLSGEKAEEHIENNPQVSEELIEAHEDFSKYALISTELVAALALFGLYKMRKSNMISKDLKMALLAVALINSGLMLYTANLGGQIMHAEIRKSAP